MMTLQDVIKAIESLSLEEQRELREYLEQRESIARPAEELTPTERARRLDEAFEQLRDGLTQEQLDKMTEAMSAE